ncbi:MAG: peptidoglycan-binding protein, partial [bacterium]
MKKRVLAGLLALFLMNILLLSALSPRAESYRLGMSGEKVTQLQTRLKSWGYYTGGVDGVYGTKTEAAVKLFQRKNGLTADGVAGPATLAAMGLSGGATREGNDVALLARLISAEARGEPYAGQVAVGAVVLNR